MYGRIPLIGALMVALLFPGQHAFALTINRIFLGGDTQATAVGGGNLVEIFNAAARVWEEVILDPFELTLFYGWAPVGGGEHTLNVQGGVPNRETAGTILFNNDTVNGHFRWFLDADPLSNSSYTSLNEYSGDFGGGVLNTGRVFTGFSASVDDSVTSCLECSDLFTSALHEIGHALGMSIANSTFIAESVDGVINVTDPRPFAGTQLPLAFNNFGVTSHFNNDTDKLQFTVMGGLNGYGLRVYPSGADILAMAQLSGFREINLEPGTIPVWLTRGFNLISIPADLAELLGVDAPTAYQVLPLLGTPDEIDRIQRMTSGPGEVQEARYTGGTPDGEDFPISPGEGLIVYATREKTLNFASAFCPTTWDLHAGANLVGTPCGPASLTAFDLLETIGDEAVVSSIQRFNSLAGRFETVAYSNGEPAGVDFPIVGGKGYVVTMKQERLGFRP